VQAVQQGQQASRSLSGATGGSTAEMSAEALLQMSDDEFETFLGIGTKKANERFSQYAGR
jgi:hypothetical protein